MLNNEKKTDGRELPVLKKILAVEREIEKRASGKLENYNRGKIHLKQMLFHQCGKRVRFVFGGNRSGKTECGAVECVYMLRGIHPFRENKKDIDGWIVSVSFDVQREVAQKKLLKYLKKEWIADVIMSEGAKSAPEYGIIEKIIVKNVFGGLSSVSFKSCEQGREKFQGASLDFVWFDEEPPRDIYEECRMRVFDKRGDIFCTMTPLKGLTFIYDEIYLNKRRNREVWHTEMQWADNPYLDPDEIRLMSETFSDDVLESRKYGKFRAAGGLVYPEFDEGLHVIDPFDVPTEWQDNISIDPGLNNPLSCHFYAVDFDGVIYVVAEHYEKGRDIDYHAKKIFETADAVGWRRDGKGRLCALIDSAANQHTLASSKSVSELFFDKGILVNTNVNKELFSGIATVKSILNRRPPAIYIFRNCVNLIRELKSYFWGGGDSPIKRDDHSLDEFRYYVMSKPSPNLSPFNKKNAVQKDKEDLYKAIKRKEKNTR
ncbi:MAG: terminase family protein [Clostridiales bacterium]|jgi:phage terminase large subunit-like protein|nr:terminase family protein [Clostridiales bacterium]